MSGRAAALDPRTVLTVSVCLAALSLVLDGLTALGVLAMGGLVLALLFGAGVGRLPRGLVSVAGLALFLVVPYSITDTASLSLVELSGTRLVTMDGLRQSSAFALRVTVVLLSGIMLAPVGARRLVAGLERWHVPAELAFMTLVAVRLLPVLRDESQMLRAAAQLRGAPRGRLPVLREMSLLRSLLVPLTIRSLRRSHHLALAAETRGFGLHVTRTCHIPFRFSVSDWVITTAALAVLAGASVLQLNLLP